MKSFVTCVPSQMRLVRSQVQGVSNCSLYCRELAAYNEERVHLELEVKVKEGSCAGKEHITFRDALISHRRCKQAEFPLIQCFSSGQESTG